jgi:hypothetical protein
MNNAKSQIESRMGDLYIDRMNAEQGQGKMGDLYIDRMNAEQGQSIAAQFPDELQSLAVGCKSADELAAIFHEFMDQRGLDLTPEQEAELAQWWEGYSTHRPESLAADIVDNLLNG